jgi:hypothetical protein
VAAASASKNDDAETPEDLGLFQRLPVVLQNWLVKYFLASSGANARKNPVGQLQGNAAANACCCIAHFRPNAISTLVSAEQSDYPASDA